MDQNLLNFWKNYEDVINWGYRITGAQGAVSSRSNAPIDTQAKIVNTNCVDEIDEYNEDVYSSDSSVDIDLEYLNFSKKTLDHQEMVEKEKRKVDKAYGFCNSPSSENESVNSNNVEEIDPKKLYGSKVDEIIYLENKLQSNFDTFCTMKKPVLWPGIAFNFSVPEPELHLDLSKLSHPFLE